MKIKQREIIRIILDVDGVIWIGDKPGEGANTFLNTLNKNNIPFCLLSNTCTVSKHDRYESLIEAGLDLEPEKLITATEITKNWLIDNNINSIMYLGTPSAFRDLSQGFSIRDHSPVDAVVIGDLFSNYNRDSLNNAAKAVIEGAILIAIQRNPIWFDGIDYYVDNGFWVAGLEYVTGKRAIITGKPNHTAYKYALSKLDQISKASNSNTFFVSDDISSDLKGAKNEGLITIHFGSNQTLPNWIDYSVKDYKSLLSLLEGTKID